jgi:2,4-dienoyl-CoA reductase-like NADH-dependent reductase (Old Yellow Enzyme family)
MSEPFKLTRIPSLKTVDEFRRHCTTLGIEIPCDDAVIVGAESPLAQPVDDISINGKRIGNRYAIQPMEGWDGTSSGGISDDMLRRWTRFGESGAKLIYGGEAMAVRPDGRANPNQLIISRENQAGIAKLREALIKSHRSIYGSTDDLVIGFQLTHSGRFCRPSDKKRLEPRIAFRHPILDRKFGITDDTAVLSDSEVQALIQNYIEAAAIAAEIGADFVDIKHCHGYLLHEFLGAHTRSGNYGGSFENRTRILREIVSGIRQTGNKIDIGVRLSAFDFVPFRPDPALSQPGKLGPGIPEPFELCLPYRYAFGVDFNNPVEYDLTETVAFLGLCAELGVKIVNLSAGSPYYNPHIQRPAAYPPSDGYQPAHDPLIDVARQIRVVKELRARASKNLVMIGTAYSYLQEYLPHVAQAVLRQRWTDMIGLGRVSLSYPAILSDATQKGAIEKKYICRTFSDCTTAPRNGLISGCYPLDKHYSAKPEFGQLKGIKKQTGA